MNIAFHWWPKHEFHLRDLQCEKTVCLGWGLYATHNMDVSQLSTFFKRHHQLDVACCWWYIMQPNGKTLLESERPKALHFEVNVMHHAKAQELLYKIYGTSNSVSTHFPCGYEMRFCPERMTATSSQQPSVHALLNRQKQFLLLVSTYQRFWGSNSLDHVHPLLHKSLCQLFTKAAPKDQPSNHTFLAIQSSPSTICVNFQKIH